MERCLDLHALERTITGAISLLSALSAAGEHSEIPPEALSIISGALVHWRDRLTEANHQAGEGALYVHGN